jgi:hypothetical protein
MDKVAGSGKRGDETSDTVFHKITWLSWLAEKLLASQEGTHYMDIFIYFFESVI